MPALPAGCVHAPDPSHSSTVQGLESAVHGVPAPTKQLWFASLQVSAHSGPPAQGFPACVHVPPEHVSMPLQKIPSSHGFVLFTWHAPAPSQWSSVHGFPSSVHGVMSGSKQLPAASLQVCAHSGPPAHGSPAWFVQPPAPSHVSAPLQKVPSLQAEPADAFGWVQVPAPSHTSFVQSFPSLAHGAVLNVCEQAPLTRLQRSFVHGSPSSHPLGQNGPM